MMTSSPIEGFPEPILILGFNRPDRLRELFDSLRPVRPKTIFVSLDGPRDGVDRDLGLVEESRATISTVDWPCDIRVNFSDVNLGCGVAVASGITWFFEHVERGIILEDDVLPSPQFYRFCAELLDRFQDDERVFAISGCNFAPTEVLDQDASYRFSGLTHVWGWATWRRAWKHYDFDISQWRSRLPLKRRWRAMGGDLGGFVYWSAVFDWMRWGRIDTWDYQWTLCQMAAGGLTATSNVNLVENVGFGEDATHTSRKPSYLRPVGDLPPAMIHPEVKRDLGADRWIRSRVLQSTTRGAWGMARDNLLQRVAGKRHQLRGGA
jgi:hypothetical protein